MPNAYIVEKTSGWTCPGCTKRVKVHVPELSCSQATPCTLTKDYNDLTNVLTITYAHTSSGLLQHLPTPRLINVEIPWQRFAPPLYRTTTLYINDNRGRAEQHGITSDQPPDNCKYTCCELHFSCLQRVKDRRVGRRIARSARRPR